MIYKGYTGVIDVDKDSGELFGTVIGLRDVVTFVGKTVEEARKSFEESIDYYLKSCQESGKVPNRPFVGEFMVRIDPETHRRLATLAAIHKLTLNEVVAKALEEFSISHWHLAGEQVTASWSSDPKKLRQEQAKEAIKIVKKSADRAKTRKPAGRTG